MDLKQEIELINNIIAPSVVHGADSGGSYDSNEDILVMAIQEWIVAKGLEDKYTMMEIEKEISNGCWLFWQIVAKKIQPHFFYGWVEFFLLC